MCAHISILYRSLGRRADCVCVCVLLSLPHAPHSAQGLNGFAIQLLRPFITLLGVSIGALVGGSEAHRNLCTTVLKMFASFASFIEFKTLRELQFVRVLSAVMEVPTLQVRWGELATPGLLEPGLLFPFPHGSPTLPHTRVTCCLPSFPPLHHQDDTLNSVFDLAFRKFKPEDAEFHLDLLEILPTACTNVLAAPDIGRYPAQKRAAIAMSEIASSHGMWLFSKAGSKTDPRVAAVGVVERYCCVCLVLRAACLWLLGSHDTPCYALLCIVVHRCASLCIAVHRRVVLRCTHPLVAPGVLLLRSVPPQGPQLPQPPPHFHRVSRSQDVRRPV